MANRGRPPMAEGERMVHVTMRLPQWVVDHYKGKGRFTVEIRKALESAALDEHHT